MTATIAPMTTWVTARRTHRCSGPVWSCPGWVRPGEVYIRTATPPGKEPFYARGWRITATCMHCATATGQGAVQP